MYKFRTHRKKIIADLITPVSVYQKIRDNFPNSILLESSDYGANDNSYAYICFNPTSTFKVNKNTVEIIYPDNQTETSKINKLNSVVDQLNLYKSKFQLEKSDSKFFENGVIGYMNYDSVQYFENIEFDSKKNKINIPDIFYSFYSNIIIINVFNNEATLLHHSFDEKNNLNTIEDCIRSNKSAKYNFEKSGKISSNLNDQEYIDLVKKGIKHCKRGDVFQIVLSRKFKQSFEGDEFNLYRALRSINPSPYLFYFDYGGYKIFGSSPEAQLVVRNNKAEIHPIAGTFLRTGDDYKDSIEAKKLAVDQKENSEHMMLVDLARNDLSRNGNNVTVEKDREIQFYSHVIHLVSKVTATKKNNSSSFQIAADTFPAGTLSGAPKHKAMQLISNYENCNRSFYGGAIGFMDFEDNFNHAIIIRSFLSMNHELVFQAGAGIVSKSNPKSELQEINNKLGALNKALDLAEKNLIMKLIVIDNYDSFTYNLVHYFEELGCDVTVKRNDEVEMSEIEKFEFLVLSPGPGIPDEAGELKNIISRFGSNKKILGVCLGHQAIAEVYGGRLKNLSEVYHGVDSEIQLTKDHYLFNDLNKPLNVGRYHSWVVEEPVPNCLEILAYDDKNHIMALKHKEYNITGVQFHPESILTSQGKEMLNNWLKYS